MITVRHTRNILINSRELNKRDLYVSIKKRITIIVKEKFGRFYDILNYVSKDLFLGNKTLKTLLSPIDS